MVKTFSWSELAQCLAWANTNADVIVPFYEASQLVLADAQAGDIQKSWDDFKAAGDILMPVIESFPLLQPVPVSDEEKQLVKAKLIEIYPGIDGVYSHATYNEFAATLPEAVGVSAGAGGTFLQWLIANLPAILNLILPYLQPSQKSVATNALFPHVGNS
jgi:hypothetical protein